MEQKKNKDMISGFWANKRKIDLRKYTTTVASETTVLDGVRR